MGSETPLLFEAVQIHDMEVVRRLKSGCNNPSQQATVVSANGVGGEWLSTGSSEAALDCRALTFFAWRLSLSHELALLSRSVATPRAAIRDNRCRWIRTLSHRVKRRVVR